MKKSKLSTGIILVILGLLFIATVFESDKNVLILAIPMICFGTYLISKSDFVANKKAISALHKKYADQSEESKQKLSEELNALKLEREKTKALNAEEKLIKAEEKKRKKQRRAEQTKAIVENKKAQEAAKRNAPVKCPKCESTQITANRKALSLKRAVIGTVLLNPVGGAIGAVTSKDVMVTCLKCGHQWKAGKAK